MFSLQLYPHSYLMSGMSCGSLAFLVRVKTASDKLTFWQAFPSNVPHVVPQGSVLDPVLFSIYVSPLQVIIHKQSIDFYFYADDNRLYISVDPEDLSSLYCFENYSTTQRFGP